MGRLRLLLALLVVVGAGGALWWVQFSPQSPNLSLAQFSPQVPDNWRDTLAVADKTVAQGIRNVADSGFDVEQLLPLDDFRRLGEATVSAQVSLTPEEVWRTFREKGSQAVLASLGDNVEYQVNDISVSAANEARYQYCKGVVEAYESRP